MEKIHSVNGRLDTFTTTQAAKRRASNTRKRAAAGTASNSAWPHQSPDPESLARSGFYFAPSASSPDNVRCYICEVNLDGWEPGDDAAAEHYAHRPECAIAITGHVRSLFEKKKELNEDPMSEKYRTARLETFLDLWPHENKRGWRCKAAKLADAGWFYDPDPELDDSVSCAYCDLAVGGWEPKDDPVKEHLKRGPNCPFFTLAEKFASSRPSTKSAKKRASRTSKIDRMSLQSAVTAISIDPVADEVNESILTAESTATTATNPSKKKATRGRKKKLEEMQPIEDYSITESVASTAIIILPPPARKTRKKNVAIEDGAQPMEEDSVESTALFAPAPARKPRKKIAVINDSDNVFPSLTENLVVHPATVEADETCQSAAPPPRQTKTKGSRQVSAQKKAPTRAPRGNKKRASDDSTKDSQPSLAHTANTSQISSPRGTKRSSSGIPKIPGSPASSMIVLEDPPSENPKRFKASKEAEERNVEDEADVEAPKQRSSSSLRQPLAELAPDIVPYADLMDTPHSSIINNDINILSDPPTPTPTRTKRVTAQRHSRTSATPRQSTVRHQRVSSDSSQSSDAENKPPSRRLTFKRTSSSRVLTNEFTTPRLSPSKRGVISQLQSQVSWEPIEMDAIFSSFSPSKISAAASASKENKLIGIDVSRLDKKNLSNIVTSVKANMAEAEQKMTVEQWVRWNAQKAQEKLNSQCESMVTAFGIQASKAQKVLEGIEHGS